MWYTINLAEGYVFTRAVSADGVAGERPQFLPSLVALQCVNADGVTALVQFAVS